MSLAAVAAGWAERTERLNVRLRAHELPYLRPAVIGITVLAMFDALSRLASFWSRYSHPGIVVLCAGVAAALPVAFSLTGRWFGRRAAVVIFAMVMLGVEATMIATTAGVRPFGEVNWAPSTLGMISLALLLHNRVRTALAVTAAHIGVIAIGGLIVAGASPHTAAAVAAAALAASLAPVGAGALVAGYIHQLRLRGAAGNLVSVVEGGERRLVAEHEARRARLELLSAKARVLVGDVASGQVPVPLPDDVAAEARCLAVEMRREIVSEDRGWLQALRPALGPVALHVADPDRVLDALPAHDRFELARLLALLADVLLEPGANLTVMPVGAGVAISAGPLMRGRSLLRSVDAVFDGVTVESWSTHGTLLLVELAVQGRVK